MGKWPQNGKISLKQDEFPLEFRQTKWTGYIVNMFLILHQALGRLRSMVGVGDAEMCWKIAPIWENRTRGNYLTRMVAVMSEIESNKIHRIQGEGACNIIMSTGGGEGIG
jgi:hypothetical protein